MASEQGLFAFPDVVARCATRWCGGIRMCSETARQRRRAAVTEAWDEIKRREREAKPVKATGLLDDVPRALARADARDQAPEPRRGGRVRLAECGICHRQDRGGKHGSLRKLPQAVMQARRRGEVRRSLVRDGEPRAASEARSGGCVARRQCEIRAPLQVDRGGTSGEGQTPEDASLEEMEALWQEAKKAEAAVK